MDRNIRIHFFPRDASRVRVIAFSRNLGVAAICIAAPLCLVGFWLALTGVLREDPGRRAERQQEERENRALRGKMATLRHESDALTRSLDSLESVRIRALMVAGLESPDVPRAAARSGIFGFLRSGNSLGGADLGRAVGQARRAALFLDSSLFVLSRNRDLADRLPTALPLDAQALVMRPFGLSSDPFTGRRSLHPGVDFSLRPGAPVYAAGGGRVVAAGADPLWGVCVRIRHTDRAETFYAHLHQARVRSGDAVVRGQVIGTLGQSGVTSGPHLHFEMLLQDDRVDPLRYLFPSEEPSGFEG